jgi:crotonobetainyl-CoA:carnitine CoA-transferase CaiB-like acyl-CoA transferase
MDECTISSVLLFKYDTKKRYTFFSIGSTLVFKLTISGGLHHPNIRPYGAYAVSDSERKIFLAVQNNAEFLRFCEIVLEKKEVSQNEKFQTPVLRFQNYEALDKIINEVFQSVPREELISRLGKASMLLFKDGV